jgi:hypothetical protein
MFWDYARLEHKNRNMSQITEMECQATFCARDARGPRVPVGLQPSRRMSPSPCIANRLSTSRRRYAPDDNGTLLCCPLIPVAWLEVPIGLLLNAGEGKSCKNKFALRAREGERATMACPRYGAVSLTSVRCTVPYPCRLPSSVFQLLRQI